MRSVQYRFGEFRLISATRQIWRDGQPIQLPRRVFDCVVYLLENRDRAIGRDELVAALWGRVDVADTQLSQLMRRVRRVLGDDGQSQQAIATVQGYGYRWAMSAEAELAPAGMEPVPDGHPTVSDMQDNTSIGNTSGDVPPPATSAVQPVRTRRWLLAGTIVLLMAAGAVFVGRWQGVPRVPQTLQLDAASIRAVVLPLEVTAPAESAWVRLGAMDVVADRLRTSGLVVPPSESVLATLQGTAATDAPDRLRDLFGAGVLVHGEAIRSAAGWRVSLRTQSGDDVRRAAEATDPDPVRAAHAAADRLAAALGRSPVNDAAEGETFDGRIARVRAALLANEIAAARKLLGADGLVGEDTIAIRYWRAQTDFRAGDLDQAQSAFNALLADAQVLADHASHGRVLIARAGVHIRRGDYADAGADFDAAVTVLENLDESAEYAEALAGRGIARVALKRFDEAASDLGRAKVQMERAGDAFGATRVDANLGLFELVRRRPAAALPYLHGAAARFEAFGAIGALLSTLNAQFDAYADLLRWQQAMDVSDRRHALRERAADPMQRYLIGVDRSRALAAMGRYREANQALDGVENEFPDMRKTIRQVLHAQRAELAWREGQAARALAIAKQGLGDVPCTDASAPCGTLVLVYQRALVAAGEADAAPLAPALRMLPDRGAAALASPAVAVAEAEWSAHQGHPEAADARFAKALADVQDEGAPSDISLVANAYAHWLIERERFDEAASVAGRVAAWAEHDFDCALLQVAVLRAYGRTLPWAAALQRARALAGERTIPAALATPPG